jgi:autotransporter-associated beta strand protein
LTAVSAGVINVQNDAALGATAGATTVASGAAIQIDGSGLLIAEPIASLIGSGIGGAGALRNLANDNTWSGAITLGAGGATINSDNGTLTLSGAIGGNNRPLTVGGAGDTTISNVIGTTNGTLTKDGTGTLTLDAANTYTGVTTINAGTVSVTNAGGLGTTAGGTLVADGATLNINSVAVGAEAVTLNGAGVGGNGVLTATGMAGVPGGSLPLIGLILVRYDVPAGAIAIVLGVDRLLDMCRTMVNVTGDLTTAVFVARSERGREEAAPEPAQAPELTSAR